MRFKIVIANVVFFSLVYAKENGRPCVTPNGENALCVPINSCTVIKEALTYLEQAAVDFARKSQCGTEDGRPLVCCGSSAGLTTTTAAPTAGTILLHSPANSILSQPIDDVYLPDRSVCGIQAAPGKNDRILGGEITGVNEFPWMVTLKYVEKDNPYAISFRCAGTLINHRHVLTAAQCLYINGYNLTEARLGEWRYSTEKDCDEDVCADPFLDVPIIQKIRHPYYTSKSGNNDIALLLLGKRVEFTDFVRPVCLPPPDFPPPAAGAEMVISGWGVTENGSLSDVKLKAKIVMRSNSDCVQAMPDYININVNQACAGGEAGRDACSGDSGGPLMRTYRRSDDSDFEQWYQEGIIYRGLGCGQEGVPGLYTRVSRYVAWILNNLKYH